MAKTWSVELPISGKLILEVEANTKAEAIDKALEGDYSENDIEEWSAEKYLVRGNVFYGVLSEANAELIDDGEE